MHQTHISTTCPSVNEQENCSIHNQRTKNNQQLFYTANDFNSLHANAITQDFPRDVLQTLDRVLRLMCSWSRNMSLLSFYGTVRFEALQYSIMSAAIQTASSSEGTLLSYNAVHSKKHHFFFNNYLHATKNITLLSHSNNYSPSDRMPRKPTKLFDFSI